MATPSRSRSQHRDEIKRQLASKPELQRLAKNDYVIDAIEHMCLAEEELKRLVSYCVEALENKTTFRLRLAQEKRWIREAKKVAEATQYLRGIVEAISAEPRDSLSAFAAVTSEQRRLYRQSLYEINSFTELRARAAEETPRRIGATRKVQQNEAAENAAIGWLAASIKKIKGRPFETQACIIAQALLSTSKISEPRLRRATKNVTTAPRTT